MRSPRRATRRAGKSCGMCSRPTSTAAGRLAVVLAHRRVDVREFNGDIRAARQEAAMPAAKPRASGYATNDGARAFRAGRPRAVPGEQSRSWREERDARNGAGGRGGPDHGAARQCAGAGGSGGGIRVDADYAAIDHGYATTIHKSQGATVDRAYVMSVRPAMDRHLTYVAMTRHREEAWLYADRQEFKGKSQIPAQPLPTGYGERRGFGSESGISSSREKIGRGWRHRRLLSLRIP